MAGQGHNSSAEDNELRVLIERVERLEEEKKGIADDIKDVFGEAKVKGYDTRTIKEMIRLRKLDADARREAEALREHYMIALGIA